MFKKLIYIYIIKFTKEIFNLLILSSYYKIIINAYYNNIRKNHFIF